HLLASGERRGHAKKDEHPHVVRSREWHPVYVSGSRRAPSGAPSTAEEVDLQDRREDGLREAVAQVVVEGHDVRALYGEDQILIQVRVGGQIERLAPVVLQAA